MKRIFILFALCMLLVITIGFSSALLDGGDTQVNPSITSGLAIDYPKFDAVILDDDFNLTIDVYNISNGVEIINSLCNLQIQDISGSILLNQNLTYLTAKGYNLYLLPGNFSVLGIYSFNIYCSIPNANLGGFASGNFEITTTGNQLNTSQGLLYLGILVVLLALFFVALFGGIAIPFQNQRSPDGKVVSINWKKHAKIFCWGMVNLLLLAVVYVTWNLIYGYAQWQTLGLFFQYLYYLLMALNIVFLPILFVMSIVNYVTDKNIEKFMKTTGEAYHG